MPTRKHTVSIEKKLEVAFPPIHDSADFMRLFGRLEEKLDGQARSMTRVEERLDDGLQTMNDLTATQAEQSKNIATIIKRQAELKTAITVDGAVNFTIRWGKIASAISLTMGALTIAISWLWHLSPIAAFVKLFKGPT